MDRRPARQAARPGGQAGRQGTQAVRQGSQAASRCRFSCGYSASTGCLLNAGGSSGELARQQRQQSAVPVNGSAARAVH